MKNISNGVSSLKSKVDKLDIEKLETTPLYLSKLSMMMLLQRLNTILR